MHLVLIIDCGAKIEGDQDRIVSVATDIDKYVLLRMSSGRGKNDRNNNTGGYTTPNKEPGITPGLITH